MESKNLPVLWISVSTLQEDMEAGYGNAIASLEPRGRKPHEPYIPVARVREMIATLKRDDEYSVAIESVEALIADVEEA